MRDNYLSAGEHFRNLADAPDTAAVLETRGKFRIVRLPPPYVEGSELWIVNEKGFLWEPVSSLDAAFAYLETPEAKEYQDSSDKV